MPLTTLFAKSGTAFTPNRAKKGLGKGISEGVLFSRMQMHTFDANYNYNHNYNSTTTTTQLQLRPVPCRIRMGPRAEMRENKKRLFYQA